MRISFDTYEDTYADALAVLRRAYGRRTPVRRPADRTSVAETVESDAPARAAMSSSSQGRSKRQIPTEDTARGGTVDAGQPTAARKGTRKQGIATKRVPTTKPPTNAATDQQGTAIKAPATTKSPATKKKAPTKKATTPGENRSPRKSVGSTAATARRGRVPRSAAPAGPANIAPPGKSEDVRAWARKQGMQVSGRGRIAAHVITAYREAHEGEADAFISAGSDRPGRQHQ